MIKTIEQVSEEEKRKALEQGLPDPDFDFREYYAKGDIVYYAYINELMGVKQVIEIKIRTVYARTMIGFEEESGCHMLGINVRDRIFQNKAEADSFLKSVKVVAKYG